MTSKESNTIKIPEWDMAEFKELCQQLSRLLPKQHIVLGLPHMHGIEYIMIKDVLYLKGESAQTSLHMANGKHYIVNRTLRECEEKLNPLGFCRIHKSFVVNLQQIRKYTKGEGRTVELADGTKIDVTRGYYETFISKLIIL